MATSQRLDAIIVGAGFSGLYMLFKLRQKGFTARIVEAASGVGGTWYWNRYPGARCDIESMQYSYQFDEALQQEWVWKERYAAQPDILAYIEHVADRFDLKRDIIFDTRVTGATFDEASNTWRVETDRGETLKAPFFIMSVGCLSTTITPTFEGMADFKGRILQTGQWPREKVSFEGRRVGVIGTGSSAVQAIPLIAAEAAHLDVFQRTANYVVPAQNRALTREEVLAIKTDYKGFRALAKKRPSAFWFPHHTDSAVEASVQQRLERFDAQWRIGGLPFLGAFGDLLTNPEANRLVTAYWTKKIREVVTDQRMAELLTPRGDIFGCKRLCSGTGYYEAFNRSNVNLVDISESGIERFTPAGLIAGGREYLLDYIVCATGFDAMTGSVTRIAIKGRGGKMIQEAWSEGPCNYLGLAVAEFPNMFNMVSVGGPSVLATMVTCSEQHGDLIAEMLTFMRERGLSVIEAKADAQARWGRKVEEAAAGSLRSSCNSWYVGSNVSGKPRVFMPWIGGFPSYVEACEAEVASGYPGFSLTA